MFSWTEEAATTLTEMWAHHSAAEIAGALGTTRNSVIGKVHRLGLEAKKAPPRRASYRPRRPDGELVEAAPMLEIPMLHIPLVEATDHQCRWITDVPGPDGLSTFCGLETVGKTSWCIQHLAIVAEPAIYSRKRAAA